MGKMDLWYGFACHSVDLLKGHGILCFIAQNNWTTSAGAKKMRDKVIADTRILQLLDFNTYMVFENADIQTMIMLFEKNQSSDEYIFDYRKLIEGAEREDMIALLNKLNLKTSYRTPLFNRSRYANSLLTFSANDDILDKIAQNKQFLQGNEIAQGIVFPQDFLDRKGANKLNNAFPIGTGIFGLSEFEYESMSLNNKELSLIKPYFTSEQIYRYYTNPNNTKWLIYTDSSFKRQESLDDYPNIKRHLDHFKDIFTSDNKPYGLHRSRKESFFQGEKIISLRKCVGQPSFSYSDFDCYVTQTFFLIKTLRWNLKFLTGVLNSKLIAFWLRNRGKMQGANYQVDKEPLMHIPLPNTNVDQIPIIKLVNVILDKLKQSPNSDISIEEAEINSLVYQIYNLTENEIHTVEHS